MACEAGATELEVVDEVAGASVVLLLGTGLGVVKKEVMLAFAFGFLAAAAAVVEARSAALRLSGVVIVRLALLSFRALRIGAIKAQTMGGWCDEDSSELGRGSWWFVGISRVRELPTSRRY